MVAQVLDEVQVVDLCSPSCSCRPARGASTPSGVAGEEEQQVVLQVVQRLRAESAAATPRRGRRAGSESRSARRRPRCTGPACRSASPRRSISMWQACSARSCGMDKVLLVGVQRLEQRRGEAARRAEAGARRDVGHAGDFQSAAVDARPGAATRGSIGCWTLVDAVGRAPACEYLMMSSGTKVWCRVMQTYLSMAAAMQEAGVLLVVRRQVGAAAAQRDPQRAARDNHRPSLRSDALSDHAAADRKCRRDQRRQRARLAQRGGRVDALDEVGKLVAPGRSSPGYSQMVVSGGPICGSMR